MLAKRNFILFSVPGDWVSLKDMPLQECPGQQCNSGRRCIPLSKLCDSKADCLNAEDETFCNDNYLEKSAVSLRLSTDNVITPCENSSFHKVVNDVIENAPKESFEKTSPLIKY